MANNHQNIKASKTNKDVSFEASQFIGPIPYSGEIEKANRTVFPFNDFENLDRWCRYSGIQEQIQKLHDLLKEMH